MSSNDITTDDLLDFEDHIQKLCDEEDEKLRKEAIIAQNPEYYEQLRHDLERFRSPDKPEETKKHTIRSHDINGKALRDYPDSSFIDALKSGDFVTTTDIATKVKCSPRTVLKRMDKLEEVGKVVGNKAGKTKIWKLIKVT